MSDSNKIKVFVVDDSAVARQSIILILNKENRLLRVIGSAPNGKIALEKLKLPKYEADVAVVDLVMPEMDGIELINNIMRLFPIPIVAVSAFKDKKYLDKALSKLGNEVFESGVIEFIKKPDRGIRGDFERFERQLLKTVSSHASIDLIKSFTVYKPMPYLKDEDFVTKESSGSLERKEENVNKIIVIGASTGGPKAISFLLSQMKPISPPIVIIQHMPKEMMSTWCSRLQKTFPKLRITLAKNREKIRPNRIYIASGGRHCEIEEGRTFRLFEGQKINFVAPAVDVTFTSAAKVYTNNVLGIILSGMGNDGCKGAREIKRHGGVIFVEHESTCVIFSMPYAVIESKLADKVIPLHQIPATLRINEWL